MSSAEPVLCSGAPRDLGLDQGRALAPRIRDELRRRRRGSARFGFGGEELIAATLARAGWKLSARSVRRILKEKPGAPPPAPPLGSRPTRPVVARFVHHVWMMDVTQVQTFLDLRQFHVAGVYDAFSRVPLALTVFDRRPNAPDMARLVRRFHMQKSQVVGLEPLQHRLHLAGVIGVQETGGAGHVHRAQARQYAQPLDQIHRAHREAGAAQGRLPRGRSCGAGRRQAASLRAAIRQDHAVWVSEGRGGRIRGRREPRRARVPCGAGKTVIGMMAAARLATWTLMIVTGRET